jgi:hypothetical protein
MARIKSLLAILLTLALLVSPTAHLLADGPELYDSSGGDTSDGHPWDDDVVESDPGTGDDPNTPGNSSPISGDLPPVNHVSSAMSGSGSHFVAQLFGLVVERWLRVSEIKVVKSKPVSRSR